MYRIGICGDDARVSGELEEMIEVYAKENRMALETVIWNTGEALGGFLCAGNRVDLLFLDIRLKGQSGIEVGEFIRNGLGDRKTAIVFMSRGS